MGRSRQRKTERAGRQPAAARPPDRPARSHRPRPSADALLWGAAIPLLALIAYIPALGGGFVWDDNAYITANPNLSSAAGLWKIWFVPSASPQYYPLVHTTFWVESHLWGLDPLGYHVVNVLLHAASAVVLWRLLVRLEVPAAWFAAAVFALHPVHVESVAWATERKNVLSGLFYLCALGAYLRFALPGGAVRAWRWYALAFLLFVCALLSKTVVASLPTAVLLLLWWKRGHVAWRDVPPLLPFFAAGAALGMNTAWLEQSHVGAEGGEWALSFLDRSLVAGRAVWFYAAKLLWPHPLIFIYPRWRIDAHAWGQYLFPLTALTTVAGLWLARGRLGVGPLVAVLFFIGTLFPALGFVNVYPMRFSFVADHFQYHASIGLIVLFAASGTTALRRFGASDRARTAMGAAVLALLGVLTWRQGYVYENLESLYRDILAKNDEAWLAHNNLGRILDNRGQTRAAADHFAASLRLFPDYPEGHNNLGAVLERMGKPDEAMAHYREAVRLLPSYADGQYNLGRLLAKRGEPNEAVEHLSASIRARAEFAPAHTNLAGALVALGRKDEAMAEYRETLRLNPRHADAHLNLGGLLEERGDTAGAVREYEAAVRARPDFPVARERLAAARARLGSP